MYVCMYFHVFRQYYNTRSEEADLIACQPFNTKVRLFCLFMVKVTNDNNCKLTNIQVTS